MKEALRVIEGSAQPGEAFWRFVDAAKAESGETEVEFFGPISEFSWFGDEITPKTFKDQLYAAGKNGPITLKVNSPGGEVFAAAAIRNILRDYPGRITADIIGLCASAATVVTSAADLVRMRDTAMFMIHDPSTVAWGTLEDMRQVVTVLEQVKETILNGYQARTRMERGQLSQMMSDETWMTAQQAQEYGFVDEVVSDTPKSTTKAPKSVRAAFLNCLSGYGKAPEGMKDLVEEEEIQVVIPAEEEPSVAAEADNEGQQTAETVEVEKVQSLRDRVRAIIGGAL